MGAKAISSLCDMIRRHNGKYGKPIYGSNEEKSGLVSIEVIDSLDISDVGEVNTLNLASALVSTTIYGLLGIRSLMPDLGENILLPQTEILKNLDVSHLTMYDPVSQRNRGVDAYLQIYENIRSWEVLVTSLKSEIYTCVNGNSKVTDNNGVTTVSVKLSDKAKKYSILVAKVLLENQNLIIPTINDASLVDFDNIDEYISTTLPAYLEDWLKNLFPTLNTAKWYFPSDLAAQITANGMKYVTIGIQGYNSIGSWAGGVREYGHYWYPYVVFSTKPILTPVCMPASTPYDAYMEYTFADSQSGRMILLGEGIGASQIYSKTLCFNSDTDTDPVFDYTNNNPNISGTGYSIPGESTSVIVRAGFPWNSDHFYQSGYEVRFATEQALVNTLNNATEGGYKLMNYSQETPTSNYENATMKIQKALIDGGYTDHKNTINLNPNFDNMVNNNGCKYLSLFALVSSDNKWLMPLIFLTSQNVLSVSGSVATFSGTVDKFTMSLNLSTSGNATMYRDSIYIPAGEAMAIGSQFPCKIQASNWYKIERGSIANSYSTGTTWNATYDLNRSGDAGSQQAGNVWPAGTFVGASVVQIFKNFDVTDWSSVTPDPAYQRIEEAIHDNTIGDIIDPLIFTDEVVSNILGQDWSPTDLSGWTNTTPVDDQKSLIDGETTIQDIEEDQNDVNEDNGVTESYNTPVSTKDLSTILGQFNTAYRISEEDLHSLSLAFFHISWFDKLRGNPLDGVLSLIALPFTLTSGADFDSNQKCIGVFGEEMKYNDVQVRANPLIRTICEKTIGDFDLSKIPIWENNYRDYPPFTTAQIYIPFCGLIDLDLNAILTQNWRGNKLCIKYYVDLLTGNATVRLINKIANPNSEQTIYLTHTNVAYQIPTSAGSFASANATLLSMSGSVASAVSVFGGASMRAGIAAGVGSMNALTAGGNVNNARSSGSSGNIGYTDSMVPYIIIKKHTPSDYYSSDTFKQNEGLMTKAEGTINSYSNSYLEIEGFDLSNIGATKEEQEALAEILRTGFWT